MQEIFKNYLDVRNIKQLFIFIRKRREGKFFSNNLRIEIGITDFCDIKSVRRIDKNGNLCDHLIHLMSGDISSNLKNLLKEDDQFCKEKKNFL